MGGGERKHTFNDFLQTFHLLSSQSRLVCEPRMLYLDVISLQLYSCYHCIEIGTQIQFKLFFAFSALAGNVFILWQKCMSSNGKSKQELSLDCHFPWIQQQIIYKYDETLAIRTQRSNSAEQKSFEKRLVSNHICTDTHSQHSMQGENKWK